MVVRKHSSTEDMANFTPDQRRELIRQVFPKDEARAILAAYDAVIAFRDWDEVRAAQEAAKAAKAHAEAEKQKKPAKAKEKPAEEKKEKTAGKVPPFPPIEVLPAKKMRNAFYLKHGFDRYIYTENGFALFCVYKRKFWVWKETHWELVGNIKSIKEADIYEAATSDILCGLRVDVAEELYRLCDKLGWKLNRDRFCHIYWMSDKAGYDVGFAGVQLEDSEGNFELLDELYHDAEANKEEFETLKAFGGPKYGESD